MKSGNMRRLVAVVVLLTLLCAAMTAVQSVLAAAERGDMEPVRMGMALLGAGIAIGGAGLGAGVGLGTASAAIVGVVAEKPEMFGRSLLYIVFIEAIAIYGLVVSFMLMMTH